MLPSRGSGERQPLGVGRLSGDAARAVGLLSQALTNVRSFDRGCASEVRPCLSCCNERAHGTTSSPGICKQRRLPVPSSVPVDHAPWCGGRVAPSPGTRAAINGVSISRVGWIWAKTDLAIFSQRNQARKKQAGPADAISYRVRRGKKNRKVTNFPDYRNPLLCPLGGPVHVWAWALIGRFYLRQVLKCTENPLPWNSPGRGGSSLHARRRTQVRFLCI
mmetsp:Transcript_105799/g.305870  ORF Transcript_105799/g.305870 Transcript_105799/m.305870 type:complete len:219 (+) Transcript_105799:119-775(+)